MCNRAICKINSAFDIRWCAINCFRAKDLAHMELNINKIWNKPEFSAGQCKFRLGDYVRPKWTTYFVNVKWEWWTERQNTSIYIVCMQVLNNVDDTQFRINGVKVPTLCLCYDTWPIFLYRISWTNYLCKFIFVCLPELYTQTSTNIL